jgi:hypothetical protein
MSCYYDTIRYERSTKATANAILGFVNRESWIVIAMYE